MGENTYRQILKVMAKGNKVSKSNKSDKMSYGLSILIFGLIYLMNKVGILAQIPYGNEFLSLGAFFLITGIVFLIFSANKKLGIGLAILGIIMKSDLLFGWMHSYSKFIVPVLLIAFGLYLVITSKK